MVVNGVLVTTKLRTALDLGRSLWRFDALAALDAFLASGVEHDELLSHVERFKGDRGVVQLRVLAPLADGRSESPAESALRLHWIEAALPTPQLQIWVYDDHGRQRFRVDLGLEEITYGAEFDGEEFHGPDRQAYDESRRAWLREERGWVIEVFRKEDVYAPGADPGPRLRAGLEAARRRHGAWSLR
jgi:very-short-patch-repair endonuclease